MKKVCIYHKHCLDGITSAWIVNRALDNVEFIGGSYGTLIDLEAIKDADVYFVDFSCKRDEMLNIIEVANRVIILDHHASAEKELDGLELVEDVFLIFDMKRSGAMITWEHFYPGKGTPWVVDIVQDRDLWQFKYPNTKAITAYMFSLEQTFQEWEKLFMFGEDQATKMGEVLETKFNKDVDSLIDSCTGEAYLEGHLINVSNVPYLYASEVGNRTVGDNRFALVYYIHKDGSYRCSLRAKDGIDVSKIAERFGGGGHPNAAGFKTMDMVWEPICHYRFSHRGEPTIEIGCKDGYMTLKDSPDDDICPHCRKAIRVFER